MIDNYDSFTYNLVDYLASAGAEVRVERNDAITPDEAEALVADAPGRLARPGHARPRPACRRPSIERLAGRMPVLGVCLGHQVIVELFGGEVGRAAG